MAASQKTLASILLVFWICIVIALTIKGAPGNFSTADDIGKLTRGGQALESPHSAASYIQMLSYLWGHASIDPALAARNPYNIGYLRGILYSMFPPGIASVALIFYSIGSVFDLAQIFAFFGVALFAIAAAYCMYLIARDIFKLPTWLALLAPTVYTFGTPSLIYTDRLYQHGAFAFFFCLLFYLSWKYGEKKENRSTLAPLIIGLYAISGFFDYPNYILLFPVIIYWGIVIYTTATAKNKKNSLRLYVSTVALTLVFILGVNALYNYSMFGHPKQFSNTLPNYAYHRANMDFLALNSDFIAAQKRDIGWHFKLGLIPQNLNIMFIQKNRSIFYFSPILLLACIGLGIGIRKRSRPEMKLLLATSAVNILFYATFTEASGGWILGQRYLTPLMIVLSFALCFWLNEKKDTWKKALSFVLLAYSVFTTLTINLTTAFGNFSVDTTWYGIKNLQLLFGERGGTFFYDLLFRPFLPLPAYMLIVFLIVLTGICIIFLIGDPKQKILRVSPSV